MRKDTLLGLSMVISFALIYTTRELMASYGYRTSYFFIGAATVSVFVYGLLYLLNKPILRRSKEQGRDIEEEERYESDYGMISLTRRDDTDNE